MCCYKLVTCDFVWWGLQGRVEKLIQKVSTDVAHVHAITSLAWAKIKLLLFPYSTAFRKYSTVDTCVIFLIAKTMLSVCLMTKLVLYRHLLIV